MTTNIYIFRDSTKNNSEFGAEVLAELGTLAQKTEFDKVWFYKKKHCYVIIYILGTKGE